MAGPQYFLDFEREHVNVIVPGWTWRGGGSELSFWPRNLNAPIKDRVLRVRSQGGGEGKFHTWDEMDLDAGRATIDILGVLVTSQENTELQVAVRGQGLATVTDYYAFSLQPSVNTVRIRKVVASGILSNVASAAYTFDAGADHFFRMRANGTSLQLRIWEVGEAEPAAWNINATDAALSAAGWFGVAAKGGPGSTPAAYVNCLSIVTGGGTAITPRTAAEFLAWCDAQDQERCFTAELSAVGFSAASSTFRKSVPFYWSNMAYTSKYWDAPSERSFVPCIATVPSFDREMDHAFYGTAQITFSDMVIVKMGPEFETWRRYVWERGQAVIRLGHPSWPLHDFRVWMRSRLREQPVGDGPNKMKFPFSSFSDVLDAPVRAEVIGGTGAFANAQQPMVLGHVKYLEPPSYDSATNQFQVHGNAGIEMEFSSQSNTRDFGDVLDNFISLKTSATVSSADAGADTISTAAAHGMLIDYRVFFRTGTPPSPLAIGTEYYVVTVPTATSFKLSETRGGAAVNITTTTAGATFDRVGWWYDFSTNRLTLPSKPVGRVLIKYARQVDPAGPPPLPYNLAAGILDWVIFNKMGTPRDFQDEDSFTAFSNLITADVGLFIGPEPIQGIELVNRIISRVLGWFGWSPDAYMQVGRIDPPGTVPEMEFTQEDVVSLTLKPIRKVLPMDRPSCEVRYAARYYAQGLPQTANDEFAAAYQIAPRLTAPGAVTPLAEQIPEAITYKPFETLYIEEADAVAEQNRIAGVYKDPNGVYELLVRNLRAHRLPIGKTVKLTHPDFGWKLWTADDPVSPDNPATIDSRLAVVVGVKPDAHARTVRLLLMRPSPMQAPEYADDLPPRQFSVDLVDSVVPEIGYGAPDFGRGAARTITDNTGSIVAIGAAEVGFIGARRSTPAAATIENHLLTSESFGAWSLNSASGVANVAGDSRGVFTLDKLVEDTSSGAHFIQQVVTTLADSTNYTVTFEIKAAGRGRAVVQFRNKVPDFGGILIDLAAGTVSILYGAPISYGIASQGGGLYEVSMTFASGSGATAPAIDIYLTSGVLFADLFYTGDGVSGACVGLLRLRPASSVYRAVGNVYPYYGAMADQVQYHRDTAGGAAISYSFLRGAMIETGRTQVAVAPRDYTNAAYAKTNVTVGTGTGMDGSTQNIKLTATAGNGTVLQTVADAATNRAYSVRIKRVTGTGTIQITQDGGATWTTVAGITTNGWTKGVKVQSQLNPQFGIRIVTNTDAILADFTQLEAGDHDTSPIPVGTTDRFSDQLYYPVPGNLPTNDFAVAIDWTPLADVLTILLASYVDANNSFMVFYQAGVLYVRKIIAGSAHFASYTLAVTPGLSYRIAGRLSAVHGIDIFVNGDKGVNNTNVTAAPLSPTFQIGGDGVGNVYGSGCFRFLRVIPGDLTDEQMADLSS